MALATGPIE